MTADQRFLAIGIYLNSALYCTGIYCAGLIYHREMAWKFAIATAAVCYLSYYAQIAVLPRPLVHALTLLSIICGIFAALPLVTA